jgi:hypothetical protein
MFTHLHRQGTHLPRAAAKTGTRLRRAAAVLATVACGLLGSAITVPAAFAMAIPALSRRYGHARVAPVPAATGGMAGWQIVLISLGVVVVAAAAAFLLDRAQAARRAAAAPTA